MNKIATPLPQDVAAGALLDAVRAALPAMRAHAPALDRTATFPADDIDALRQAGALIAPLPQRLGGLGLGTEPRGGPPLCDLLRMIGTGNLAVGRLFEGHVNAIALICRYGTDQQIDAAARDAIDGHLFGIWNAEAPPGVRSADDGTLSGQKIHCSGAGAVTRALITADQHEEGRMLAIALAPAARARPMPHGMHGMRATASGVIDLEGYITQPTDWIGAPGDYMREPAFSAGAWRTLAVILGGLDTLVNEIATQLRRRRREDNPYQRARLAQAFIAQETASLWIKKAALMTEEATDPTEDIVAYVNLARGAVETAAFDIIQIAQRSLGIAAMLESNPAERLARDLTTYLRQPAMDEALEEAAGHFVGLVESK
jgi:alkylation response protein AidB-like acyl-CoA dehydrogenase